MVYYVLVKRKNSKKWLDAIPLKKGITKKQAQSAVRSGRKKGFSYRIVTLPQLKKMFKK